MARAGTWVVFCSLIGSLVACGEPEDSDGGDGSFGGSGGTTVPAAGAGAGGNPGAGTGGAGAGGAGAGGNSSSGAGTGGAGAGGAGAGGAGTGGAGAGGAGAGGAGAGGAGGAGAGGSAGAGDPCENLTNPCDDEGVECDGETLVVCAENADDCLVETRTDCTAGANDICDEGADPPVCKPDPCLTSGGDLKAGACEEEGEFCSGHFRVVCERDSAGCPIAEITDCTDDDDNNACEEDGDEADCIEDPCIGVPDACDEEDLYCDGTDLVSCAERGPDDCLLLRVTECADDPSESCDDSVATPRCDDCDNECTSVGTSCSGDTFRTCANTDADNCLELEREICGESCDPEDGCVWTNTCDGPTHAVLVPNAANGPYDTEAAGNDFSSFGCSGGNESGPDLLFAIDVPAESVATIELDGEEFEAGAPILILLTDCSDEGAGNAEDSCSDDSPTEVSYVNEQDSTERVYLVVDGAVAENFGTFGLDLELRELECGDGLRDPGEECDDGNALDDDGCDDGCDIEDDYACTSVEGALSVCTLRPTDGRCGPLRCALPAEALDGSELCCTVDARCGLAFPEAYGDACIALEQPGDNDNGCDDEQGSGGWPTMTGCCRDEDDMCGLMAGPGVGCVLRSEVWTALQDGPGNIYTGGPYTDEECN